MNGISSLARVTGPLAVGALAFSLMLAIYFGVVGLISGLDFTLEQFARFRYFILALALGFAVQAGLYARLRQLAGLHDASGKVIAVSGSTSSAAMVPCGAHYLANGLPMLGAAGVLCVIAE